MINTIIKLASGQPVLRNHFNSVSAIVDAASADPSKNGSSRATGAHFYGTDTFEDAVALTVTGWADRPDLSAFAKAIETETAKLNEDALSLHYAPAGAFPDVPECLSGNPDCMASWHHSHNPRTIRLGFQFNGLSDVTPDMYARRGAILLTLVNALITEGYQVELYGVYASQSLSGSKRQCATVLIKPATQYLEIDTLAFWACHRAAQRRIGFAILERMPSAYVSAFAACTGGGYGSTIYDAASIRVMAADLELDELVALDHSTMRSDTQCAKWLADKIESIRAKA